MKKIDHWLIGLSSAGVVAGLIFLLKRRRERKDERPPRRAPQLHLNNPGTQDEFLTAASESELG